MEVNSERENEGSNGGRIERGAANDSAPADPPLPKNGPREVARVLNSQTYSRAATIKLCRYDRSGFKTPNAYMESHSVRVEEALTL